MKRRYLIGIDEAGRGPLAGPVAVGVVCLDIKKLPRPRRFFHGVKETKQLTPRQREVWWQKIKKLADVGNLRFAVSLVGHHLIDRQGIAAAVRLGIRRCLSRFVYRPQECLVLLDGSLCAPRRWVYQRTIIRGDETEPPIALASIVAKVRRDRRMLKLDKVYPQYFFREHKGYGTRKHYHALKKHGPSPIHRLSFLH